MLVGKGLMFIFSYQKTFDSMNTIQSLGESVVFIYLAS